MGDSKVAAVLGIGPALGGSVARRFAQEGYDLVLMARGEDKLTPVREQIEGTGRKVLSIPTDASKPESVAAAFARAREELGYPEVFIYNAGAFQMGGIMDISPEAFETCWKANCFGAFLGAREVLPAMTRTGKGTILLTGATASIRGSSQFSCLAVGKFGLRALAQSMGREFGPQGVHVAHVVIDGQIDTPRVQHMMPGREKQTLLAPDAIAETYWQLHRQDPTAWTLELDVRPSVEKF